MALRRERMRLGDLLIKQNVLTEDELKKALALQKGTGKKIGEVLVENGFITEDMIVRALQMQLGLKVIQLTGVTIPKEVRGLVGVDLLKKYTCIPFVKQLSQGYEYVIIDAPSVGQVSNALSLNQIAHMAVLVIRYDLAVIQDIQSAIDKLDKSGTRILGCVVNAAQSIEHMGSQRKEKYSRNSTASRRSQKTKNILDEQEETVDNSHMLDELTKHESEKTMDATQEKTSGKITGNIFEDLIGEEDSEKDMLSDQEAMDALLKMGVDGSWKNEADESDKEE